VDKILLQERVKTDGEDEWARVESAARGISSTPTGTPSSAPGVAAFLAKFHAKLGLSTPSTVTLKDDLTITSQSVASSKNSSSLSLAAVDSQYDREYYDAEEFGVAVDTSGGESGETGPFLGDAEKFKAREEAMARARSRGDTKLPGMSAKRSALMADQEAWEMNRLRTSGAMEGGGAASGAREEEEQAHLLVHNRRPPFLLGRDVGSMGGLGGPSSTASSVSVVKDPTSDIAQLSRRGSESVKKCREKRDRNKMKQKFWELGGTKMGDVVGVKGNSVDAEVGDADKVEALLAGDADLATKKNGDTAAVDSSTEGLEEKGLGDSLPVSVKFSDAVKNSREEASSSHFSRTLTITQQRQFLPIHAVRGQLLAAIAGHQVVVVVGETGSGKTTQLAQYLMEEGYCASGEMVGCTQPRRVAAVSVAKRVAEEVGTELGTGSVGYSIRFEDATSPATRLKFMTDGVLLRETLRDGDLDSYSAIIMDEAHERSLNTDVLFGILRGVVARRRDFRLIVTSATLDSGKFSDFFGGAPVFHIPGRTFPVTKHYAKCVPEDYVDAAVRSALTIHLSNPPGSGDILVFMTGQEDIEATCECLVERVEALSVTSRTPVPPLLVLPMYSLLPADLQARIFQRSATGARKVIVATNIAETSLTVDGVAFVVDPGLAKVKVYNPRIGMDALQVLPVSQASANQRAGRAGRTGPGTVHRLYTESTFRRELLPLQIPEIQRTNLGNVVLLLKSLGVLDLRSFPFMDAPPGDNLSASEYGLWVMGALDDAGGLTEAGKRMVDFPVDPPLAKMLYMATSLGCTREVATVVSLLSTPGIFFRPRDREAESDAARERFLVPESDHLTLLNVHTQWKRAGGTAAWCAANFVHVKALSKADEVLTQLLDIMTSRGIPITSCSGDWDVVRKAVCSGYFYNSARLKGVGEYCNLLNGLPASLHPSSALFGLGYTPPYVVYHELTLTTKEYMSCVTAVEPEWLCEMGPAFFSLRGGKPTNFSGSAPTPTPLSSRFASSSSSISRRSAYESAPTPILIHSSSSSTFDLNSKAAPIPSSSTAPKVSGNSGTVVERGDAQRGTLAQRMAEAKAAVAASKAARKGV